MNKKTLFLIPAMLGTVVGSLTMTGCMRDRSKPDVYENGKLVLDLRNLYFDTYSGGDTYLAQLEEKFQIKCKFQAYSWAKWSEQVTSALNGDNAEDVFHANVDSYNFASTYKYWAEEQLSKPLPEDLSKWPNLKKMIDNTTNIDSLKLDGRLYGIPVSKNARDPSTSFSPFTYVYRRDWAKKWGVYQENDEYTWAQFEALLEKFRVETKGTGKFALGDVEWGYPSITNFYKQVPHCFAQDELTGKYVNNYTTEAYIQGLEQSKRFETNGWYGYGQYTATDGELNKQYYQNNCGVLYENLSYSNYYTLRHNLEQTNALDKAFDVDDATAIMKIKGQDGKYVLEGTDNWFSMTFFDYRISDTKMNKILDLLDYLLSEEGTRDAIFGKKGYDYTVDDAGDVQIVEKNWTKDKDGSYVEKINGGRYLRYLVSLGYDTFDYDPITNKSVLGILNNWDKEMKDALSAGTLKVLKENAEVMWLTSPLKAEYSGLLRSDALKAVTRYIENDIKTVDEFKNVVESDKNYTWKKVLDEINTTLKK